MMFAVIETATGVALHLLGEEPEITATGMVSPVRALDIKAATHSVIEIDAPTVTFLPGVMAVVEGEWLVPDQDTYDALLAALTPPVAVPEEISDRQFFEALATVGLIPRAEAIAAVSVGAVPTAMEAFFAGMDEDAEFKARMLLQGAITFHRHHPLVEAFGAMQGMTAAQIDDLWRTAATL